MTDLLRDPTPDPSRPRHHRASTTPPSVLRDPLGAGEAPTDAAEPAPVATTVVDREAAFDRLAAALRAVADEVARVTAATHLREEPTLDPGPGARLAALADLHLDADLEAAADLARGTLQRLDELATLGARRRGRGDLAPLGQLAARVSSAHYSAVEAYIAAGPHGDREAVLPPTLLDLPSELVRATAELDELAAARSRSAARRLLRATDLLVQLGRDAHRLCELVTR